MDLLRNIFTVASATKGSLLLSFITLSVFLYKLYIVLIRYTWLQDAILYLILGSLFYYVYKIPVPTSSAGRSYIKNKKPRYPKYPVPDWEEEESRLLRLYAYFGDKINLPFAPFGLKMFKKRKVDMNEPIPDRKETRVLRLYAYLGDKISLPFAPFGMKIFKKQTVPKN